MVGLGEVWVFVWGEGVGVGGGGGGGWGGVEIKRQCGTKEGAELGYGVTRLKLW